jgi:hypothetical protein
LRPLFSIGVHDIPLLEDDLKASKRKASSEDTYATDSHDEKGCGWIACTTDSIFATKTKLYDVLITMPPAHSSASSSKVWPKIASASGTELKATQRDLRRFKALRWGLSRSPRSPALSRRTSTESHTIESFPDLSQSTTTLPQRDDPMLDIPDTESIVEPVSWSALAYSGFIWWASAGEQRLHSQEEWEADASLLSTPHTPNPFPSASMYHDSRPSAEGEMAIIAYFHRLTTQILTILGDIIDASDSDDEREDNSPLINSADGAGDSGDAEDEGGMVYVSSVDMERMGLDVWSAADHAFVEELVKEYFGRRVKIEGRGVDICGVRIC